MSDHAGQNGASDLPRSSGPVNPIARKRRRELVERLMDEETPPDQICAQVFNEFGVSDRTVRSDMRWVRKKQGRLLKWGLAHRQRLWWNRLQAALRRTGGGKDEKNHGNYLLIEGKAIGALENGNRREPTAITGPATMSEWTRAADELAKRPEDGEEMKRIEATVVDERKEAKT